MRKFIAQDLKQLGFDQLYKNYYQKSAPGILPYWTHVVIDYRFGYDDVRILGKRGNEEEQLFRGKVSTPIDLEDILVRIKGHEIQATVR